MVGGFERGHDTAARRVALKALIGCTAKQTLKVAPFALDLGMATR
jgi:hypothetical protein